MKKFTILILACLGTAFLTAQHQPFSNIDQKVLVDPDKYSNEEVHKAFVNKAISFFSVDVDSSMHVYRQHQKYFISKNQPEYIGRAYHDMAELYYMRNQMDSAIFYFKSALPLLSNDQLYLAGAYLRIGNAYLQSDKIDSAKKYTVLASEIIFEQGLEFQYTNTYICLAEIAEREERPVTAVEMYSKALEYDDAAPIPMRKANVLLNLASLLNSLGNPGSAEDHLIQTLAICEEHNYTKTKMRTYARLAHLEAKKGNYEKAIEYYQTMIPYYIDKKMTSRLIGAYVGMAKVLLKTNRRNEAKEYLDKATDLVGLGEVGGNELYGYHSAHGNYYLCKGEFTKAEKSYDLAHQVAIGTSQAHLEVDALIGKIKLAGAQDDTEEELLLTRTYYQKKDSLFNLEQSRLIFDYEARYQKAEKDLAISELNTANEIQTIQLADQKKQLILSLAALGVFAILSFLLFRLYRKVAQQNRVITKSNDDKAILLKEIHHRVKNNLQVVSSLLGLQSRFVNDGAALEAIKTGRARVQSMSILHQNLYRNENLKTIQLSKYFDDLGHNLFSTYQINDQQIEFETDIDDIALDIDVVIPMGLITNELISNALKHAFKNQEKGKIKLSIKKVGDKIQLAVSDDGKGIPFTQLPEKSESLGLQLIRSFAHKLNAHVDISNKGGTSVKLTFDPAILIAKAA